MLTRYRSKLVLLPFAIVAYLELIFYYTDTFSYAGVSFRYIGTLLLLFSMIFVYVINVRKHANQVSFYFLIFLFLANGFMVSFLNGLDSTNYLLRNLWQPVAIFLIFSNVIFINYSLSFLNMVLFVALSSCIFAVLQFVGIEWAWSVRSQFTEFIPRGVLELNRALGLEATKIRLSYTSLLAGAISYSLYNFEERKNYKKLYGIIAAVSFLSVVASGTRSAIMAFILIIGFGYWLAQPHKRKKFIVSCSFLAVPFSLILIIYVYWAMSGSGLSDRFLFNDDSAAVRIPLFKSALIGIVENPFGAGPHQLSEFINSGELHLGLSSYLYDVASNYESHNVVLNIIFYYGIQGLTIYLYLVTYFVRMSLSSLRKDCIVDKKIGLSGLLIAIGYFSNGMFHNTGFLMGEMGIVFVWAIVLLRSHAHSRSISDVQPFALNTQRQFENEMAVKYR